MRSDHIRLRIALAAAAFALAPLGAFAQSDNLPAINIEMPPSIDTPPEVSKAAMAKVKEQGRGQYSYPEGFKSDFVEANGIRLHYVTNGKGSKPVVFVHGFGSTWKMWETSLQQFGGEHLVIAIDLPGLGQSEPSKTGYSAQALSEYLFAAIKKLTKEPIIYISHDLSNTASYPMVANHQDYIRKVAFMDSPIPDKAMWTYPGYTSTGPGLGWHFGFFSFGDVAEKLVIHDPKLFMAYFIKEYAGKKELFTDALLDELIEPYSRIENLHAAASYYRYHSESIVQNETLIAGGKLLAIPSMSISGAKGVNDILPKQMAARFVKDPSKFKAVIVPGAGHWLLEEAAPVVNSILEDFIKD